ncbi:hypothetical protein GCM10027514_03350 [Azotobacter armeniacus]
MNAIQVRRSEQGKHAIVLLRQMENNLRPPVSHPPAAVAMGLTGGLCHDASHFFGATIAFPPL